MPALRELLTRLRVKRGPVYFYQTWNTFSRTVGTTAVRLSPSGSLICNVAIIQADLTNGGIVVVGGSNVAVGTGIQLTAGQAILFSSSPPGLMEQKMMMSSIGIGLLPWLTELDPMTQHEVIGVLSDQRMPRIVQDLDHVYAIASADNQILRVLYTQDVTITR